MSKHIIFFVLFLLNHFVFSQNKKFTILHTSDEHSALVPMPFVDYSATEKDNTEGGFARLASKINEIRKDKKDENVLLFSSGDIFGGSPFSWLILKNYAAEIELMKSMKYDALTIGNHEFDYGPEILAKYYKNAGYHGKDNKTSIISSNLNIPKNHPLDSIFIEENKIYTLSNGLKVGVFGYLGDGAYKLATKAKPIGIFKPEEIAKKQVEKLKNQGADIIVALSHSGIDEDRALAKKVKGIHLILGGHDHIKTIEPEKIKDTYIFHPAYYTKFLGKLEFEFDEKNKTLSFGENKEGFLIPINDEIKEDKIILKQIADYTKVLDIYLENYTFGLFKELNQNAINSNFELKNAHLEESAIGNFITDGMRIVGEKIIGEKVDFAFQANGVIRSDLKPGTAKWSKNKIPFFDLAAVSCLGSGPDNSPGNPMVSVYLTEKEIYTALEVTTLLSQVYGDIFFMQYSGLKYVYNPKNAIRFKLPFIKFPIPKFKAIYQVEKYNGEGIQNTENYSLLNPKSEKLYHVVTDYYIASFLPKIGEMLPKRAIILKDKNGNPIKKVDDSIVKNENQEFKIWESFAVYAVHLSAKGSMPDYYSKPQNRITKTNIKSRKKFLKSNRLK